MKKFVLTKEHYNLLKGINLDEMKDSIEFIEDEHSFKTSDRGLLEIILSEEIGLKWASDNAEQNEKGRKLEELYDEIYYQ